MPVINETPLKTHNKYNCIIYAMEFIRENYSENHSVQYYANLCNLDKYYFIKLFREYTNETPHYFRTKIRIEKSVELLETTTMNNTEIAEAVGYSSSYYFSRIFKKYMSVPPDTYRKNLKKIL